MRETGGVSVIIKVGNTKIEALAHHQALQDLPHLLQAAVKDVMIAGRKISAEVEAEAVP